MLIIIEGPDGAGKSTLAAELTQSITRHMAGESVEYRHTGVPSGHPLDEYLRPLTSYRPGSQRHVIIDRWHLGESVYPAIRNRATQLTWEVNWAIEAYLRRLGALLVLCHQSRAEYERVFAEPDRVADRWQLDELSLVEKLFADTYATSTVTRLMSDFSERTDTHIRDILYAAITTEKHAADRVDDYTVTYTGPPVPELLLVGDVRHGFDVDPACCGVGIRENLHDPAFVPFRATSGDYLLRALRLTTNPAAVGLVNACDIDHVDRVWRRLGGPPVVALGRNACRKLDQLNVPHGSVPHPQYVRRFHHKQVQRYADDIVRAAHEQRSIDWPSSLPVLTVETSTRRSSTTSEPTDAASSHATESSAT